MAPKKIQKNENEVQMVPVVLKEENETIMENQNKMNFFPSLKSKS